MIERPAAQSWALASRKPPVNYSLFYERTRASTLFLIVHFPFLFYFENIATEQKSTLHPLSYVLRAKTDKRAAIGGTRPHPPAIFGRTTRTGGKKQQPGLAGHW